MAPMVSRCIMQALHYAYAVSNMDYGIRLSDSTPPPSDPPTLSHTVPNSSIARAQARARARAHTRLTEQLRSMRSCEKEY